MDSSTPEPQQPCPVSCPNRKREGRGIILVFNKQKIIYLDTLEIFMWFLLALPIGITIKDAWTKDLSFRESIERIVMISASGAFIRVSPTEQISHFLSSFYIGKK